MKFYEDLQYAFDFLNRQLFNDECVPCLITLQRQANSRSYVSYDRFVKSDKSDYLHELALNPEYFGVRPVLDILKAMCHEMCHIIIYQRGLHSVKTYHNKHWSMLMESIGLIPSHNGRIGGNKVGQKMEEYPKPDGLFIRVCNDLCSSGTILEWYDKQFPNRTFKHEIVNELAFVDTMLSSIQVNEQLLKVPVIDNGDFNTMFPLGTNKAKFTPKKPGQSKLKYSCSCEKKKNIWGKSGLDVICKECSQPFVQEADLNVA